MQKIPLSTFTIVEKFCYIIILIYFDTQNFECWTDHRIILETIKGD